MVVEKEKEEEEGEKEGEKEEEKEEEEEEVSDAQQYAQTEHDCNVCVICQKKYVNGELCRVLR